VAWPLSESEGIKSVISCAAHAAWFATNERVTAEHIPSCCESCVTDASAERFAVVAILRDIFGNPFRPITLDPSWQSADVLALAQAIYDERAFDRMPILGDALEDAGCDNADVLTHCRQPGEHVRGCWCVDLVLGKA